MKSPLQTSLLLFLFAFAVYLAGNNNHAFWDRDEPRYATATREMIRTGDWIIPHFNGGIRYDKPVLIYWLMAGAVSLFGENEFAMRFPSALFGAGRTVVIFWLAMWLGCRREGALFAAIVATLAPLLLVISKAATIDSTLTLTVVGALACGWQEWRHGFSWPRRLGWWALLALSALLKGPPGPAIILLTLIVFRLWSAWRREGTPEPVSLGQALLRSVAGVAVFCLIGLPWLIAAWVRTDGQFFMVSVGRHVIERSAEAMEGHGGPVFYYLPVLIVAVLPFTPMLLVALGWGWKRRGENPMRFLWSWILPALLMFSFVQTKLPHYVAPLVPALAIMMGLWWDDLRGGTAPRAAPWLHHAGTLLLVLLGLGGLLAPGIAIALMGAPLEGWALALMSACLGATFLASAAVWGLRRHQLAFRVMATTWTATLAVATLVFLPVLDSVRPSKSIATWVRENAPPGTRLLMAEFDEPTIVFYGGGMFTTIGRGEPNRAFALLSDLDQPTALLTTADRWRKYQRERTGPAPPPEVSLRTRGDFFYFEQGEPESLVVIGNWPASETP